MVALTRYVALRLALKLGRRRGVARGRFPELREVVTEAVVDPLLQIGSRLPVDRDEAECHDHPGDQEDREGQASAQPARQQSRKDPFHLAATFSAVRPVMG